MAAAIKKFNSEKSTLALASKFFSNLKVWYISRQCQEVRLLPGQHFPPNAFYKCGECAPCVRDNKLPEGYDNGITRHSPHAMCKRKYLYMHSRHYMYIYLYTTLQPICTPTQLHICQTGWRLASKVAISSSTSIFFVQD